MLIALPAFKVRLSVCHDKFYSYPTGTADEAWVQGITALAMRSFVQT